MSALSRLLPVSSPSVSSPPPRGCRATMAAPAGKAARMRKDESLLGKLGGSLARRKRSREVSDLQEEGKHAINAPLIPSSAELHPEDTLLEENAERTMLDPTSREDAKLKDLQRVSPAALVLSLAPRCGTRTPEVKFADETRTLRKVLNLRIISELRSRVCVCVCVCVCGQVLIDWVNNELEEERIIVKDLEEDLYDGQVLQKLFEKLSGRKLNVAEVTQSEIGQKQKLQTVLEAVNELIQHHGWSTEWSVDLIHSKNLVAIISLLVGLAVHFQAAVRLPEHVSVQVLVVKKKDGVLHATHVTKELTTTTELMMGRFERDAFDTLLDHAPDKLNIVKKSLITFVNKHLNKLNLEVTELETQFADGVYLVLLMGLLENYFVPLYNFYLTPENFEQKVHNVSFAFELMQDGGLKKPKARPEDVVNLNLKSTLRVLYNLFTNYKNRE
uniref:Parvin, beta n=1 Tax=Scleropages formosus TaxID=113540 RepID=A0A8C9SWK6_SCLFO